MACKRVPVFFASTVLQDLLERVPYTIFHNLRLRIFCQVQVAKLSANLAVLAITLNLRAGQLQLRSKTHLLSSLCSRPFCWWNYSMWAFFSAKYWAVFWLLLCQICYSLKYLWIKTNRPFLQMPESQLSLLPFPHRLKVQLAQGINVSMLSELIGICQ